MSCSLNLSSLLPRIHTISSCCHLLFIVYSCAGSICWLPRSMPGYFRPTWPLGLLKPTPMLGRLGNGGLSLRRVRDHYAVLSSWRFRCWPVLGIQELLVAHPPLQNFSWHKPLPSIAKAINRVRLILMRLTSWRNSLAYFCRCGLNEDLVFGLLVPRIFVGFLVPDPATAAHFALDANPDFFYGRYFSSDCLPFGCHAWEKSYGQFWRHRHTSLPRLSLSSAD